MSESLNASPAFATTHWSIVLAAGQSVSSQAREALENLCRAYWFPLYAFARRLGHPPADAQDLTQGFFLHLFEARLVARADSAKGKFRSFLLGAFKNFIANENARTIAQRRGGGRFILSLNTAEAEALVSPSLATQLSPDELFDRSWAMAAVDEAFKRMEVEFNQTGRGQLFEKLFPFLQGEKGTQTYAGIAAELGTTEGTIKVTVNRMRRRYRELLGAVVSHTVASHAEVEEELRQLMAALRR